MLGKYVDVAGGCGEGHVPRGVPRTPVCPGARGARTPSSPAVRMMAHPAGRPRRPTRGPVRVYALRARGPAGAEPGRGAVSEGGRQSECAGSAGMVKSTSASSADRHLLPPANLARISSW